VIGITAECPGIFLTPANHLPFAGVHAWGLMPLCTRPGRACRWDEAASHIGWAGFDIGRICQSSCSRRCKGRTTKGNPIVEIQKS
jgi:hypothetical protein